MSTLSYRSHALTREKIDEAARTVELAFSSETPVDRGRFREVLSHEAEAIDLERLNAGGALLSEHDTGRQIGVVEKAYIGADRIARALVRFSRSALGEQEFQDVKDGIRRLVSVGYRIQEHKEERDGKDVIQRVTRWQPLEISLVSVPADASVGVGRSENQNRNEKPDNTMPATSTDNQTAPASVADLSAVRAAVIKEEQKRVSEILNIGKRFGFADQATQAVSEGTSADSFRSFVLDEQAKRLEKQNLAPTNGGELGMNEKEKRSYSLMRAINAAVKNDWSKAGLEKEASDALAKQFGKEARGFFVPQEAMAKRELNVGTASQGGVNVATNLMAGDFISLLRNKLTITSLGARIMSGLVGNVDISRQTGGATAYWLAESANVTNSDQAFEKITLTPKTVAARSQITRRLMLQGTPSAEQLVRDDLLNVLALEIDRAAINGTGASGQPTGILNTAGIGSVALGANGLAPTYASLVALLAEIWTDNAETGSIAYLSNPKVLAKLMTTPRQGSGVEGNFIAQNTSSLLGYNAAYSNQVPSNLTKGSSSGVCSAIIAGVFPEMLIGEWGVLDLQVDPYTSADDGGVVLRAFKDLDIQVRHPESFAAIKDALTT